MTVSARSGPIRARTAPLTARSASETAPWPMTCFDRPSADPTATVDGTSVRTAKNAISAACPVVRCNCAARTTRDDGGDRRAGVALLRPPTGIGPGASALSFSSSAGAPPHPFCVARERAPDATSAADAPRSGAEDARFRAIASTPAARQNARRAVPAVGLPRVADSSCSRPEADPDPRVAGYGRARVAVRKGELGTEGPEAADRGEDAPPARRCARPRGRRRRRARRPGCASERRRRRSAGRVVLRDARGAALRRRRDLHLDLDRRITGARVGPRRRRRVRRRRRPDGAARVRDARALPREPPRLGPGRERDAVAVRADRQPPADRLPRLHPGDAARAGHR